MDTCPKCILDSVVYKSMLEVADGDPSKFLEHTGMINWADPTTTSEIIDLIKLLDYWGCDYMMSGDY